MKIYLDSCSWKRRQSGFNFLYLFLIWNFLLKSILLEYCLDSCEVEGTATRVNFLNLFLKFYSGKYLLGYRLELFGSVQLNSCNWKHRQSHSFLKLVSSLKFYFRISIQTCLDSSSWIYSSWSCFLIPNFTSSNTYISLLNVLHKQKKKKNHHCNRLPLWILFWTY